MKGLRQRDADAIAGTPVGSGPESNWGFTPRARRWARSLAFGLGAVALVLPAAPAHAAHYQVNWTSPASGAAMVDEQTVQLEITSPTSITNGRVSEWELRLLSGSGPGAVALGTLCRDVYSLPGVETVRAELAWNTLFYPGPDEPSALCDSSHAPGSLHLPATPDAYAPNGTYTFRVWVKSTPAGLPPTQHEQTFDRVVKFSNPAETPTGVKASWTSSSSAMTVSWGANPEPDVTGYAVDQCVKAPAQTCAASDWSRVANPSGRTTTSASLNIATAGTYRYRVAAKRLDADGKELLSSAAQSDPMTIDFADTPAPTTDDGEGGSGGGGGSGGSGGSGGDGSSGGSGTAPTGTDGGSPGAGGAAAGETDRSGLPARELQRTEVDSGYEENLPYGAKPLDGAGGGALEIAARGVGIALVPMAGGVLLFVFAMQMRYLSRRADALALAGGDTVAVDGATVDSADNPADDAPVPLFRLGAGGSFISNWRRLLDD